MSKIFDPEHRYVVGFVFTDNAQRVLLIRKKRPKWQAGHLNGIGGKIEEGETPHRAMVRECRADTISRSMDSHARCY